MTSKNLYNADWQACGIQQAPGSPIKASHVTSDSRLVRVGSIFVALHGEKTDGMTYARQAVANGARLVVAAAGTEAPPGVPIAISNNPRLSLALLAKFFHPTQPAHMLAVTGTNGKTSTVWLVREILNKLGIRAASCGTLGVHSPDYHKNGTLTTPDPVALHQTLERLAHENVQHVAVEASSHGLQQHRLDGIRFTAAAFTNLSRDHLDYHKTEAAYFQAKARLFSELLPVGSTAVLNKASTYYTPLAAMCHHRGVRIFSYGDKHSDLQILKVQPHAQGQELHLKLDTTLFTVTLPLAGTFQGENLLAACGLLLAANVDLQNLPDILPTIAPVPGRLECVAAPPACPFAVYIDYAHTPDALQQALNALRPHTPGKLWVVFGCGGNRDAGKRPLMGKIAADYADKVIITDDNPRHEDAAIIRQQIAAASHGAQNIGDRRLAIAAALNSARGGDVILIAGKGHETGQIIGDTVHPYSDHQTVASLL